MYQLLRPILFQLDPERAHNLTLTLLRAVGRSSTLRAIVKRIYTPQKTKPVHAFGLTFPNPIGLAAGYDKDGLAWRGLACLGFGHIEVGTVTPRPQPGNPRPRLFRLPEDQALINRLGFPSRGSDFVASHLGGKRPGSAVLGVNMGKNMDTPLNEAATDYVDLMEKFAPLADYLVINVSSPNTIGLRRLQARQALEELLTRLVAKRGELSKKIGKTIPLLVKLAPDLSDEELDDALEAILGANLEGVVATNTTVHRQGLGSQFAREAGGLSGAPLAQRSTEMVRYISARTQDSLPIIAAGGVMTAASARQKLDAGASLVQIYTGMVYQGPGIVKKIVQQL
jgi:dihydroorotate dehydrogenase